MTHDDDHSGRASAITLVRRLIGSGISLAKLEVQHGRQEIGQMLSDTKSAAILLGIAAGLVFLALIAFVVFVVLGIAALTGLPGWLIALIAFVLLLAIAGFLGYRGVKRIRIGPPQETIASVKEDVAWAKRLLKRG